MKNSRSVSESSRAPASSRVRAGLPSYLASIALALILTVGGAHIGGYASAETPQNAAAEERRTPIRIRIGNTALDGYLNGTTMAQRLAERLPLSATFNEHPNGGDFSTKVTHLDPPLSTEGTSLGAAPGPGDIAVYVPSGNLGLYYGQINHWDGAVILGNFSGDPKLIEQQAGPFTVVIEALNPT
jgi:hypothetical protein